MSHTIFKDSALQAQFDQDGYVQIPLLEPQDIPALRTLFQQYFPNPAPGFFSSSYLPDFELKKEISQAIVAILEKRMASYFANYRLLGSAFLSKNPGKRSEMPLHQDWTIVDESEHVAVNVWTPLQDADQRNGSLQVLKGSHAFLPVMRAPTLPFFYEPYQSDMRQSLTPLSVKATEAVVLNQAVIHASPPNQTTDCRIAITTGMVSSAATTQFFYQEKPGELEVFDMEDDFFLRFKDFHKDIFQRPTFGKSRSKIPFQVPGASPESIREKIRAAAPAGTFPPQALGWKRWFSFLGAMLKSK